MLLKGQIVASSRLGWLPIRLLKEWNSAFARRKRMTKGILSVGNLIPGRPRRVKSPVGFCASYLFNASCWWSRKERNQTPGHYQLVLRWSEPFQHEMAAQACIGSKGSTWGQQNPSTPRGFYSPWILTNCIPSFVSRRTEICFLLPSNWF